MNVLRRIAELDSKVHGALTLGVLLAAVLTSLSLGSLRLYRQLDAVADHQRVLVRSQAALYALLSAQYNEETTLRAFVVTRRSPPYVGDNDASERALLQLSEISGGLHSADLSGSIGRLRVLRSRWAAEVAQPLIAAPGAPNAEELETRGKELADRLRAEASHVQTLLNDSLAATQRELVGRINETLGAGIVSLLFFGTLGVLFVGLRTRMLARIQRERSIIETLQGAFRAGMEPLPGSRLGTAYISATADAAVGGDIFDVWPLDDHRGLVLLADISGKGLEAAVNTALVKYAIRTLASTMDAPDAILAAFNRVFLDTIKDPALFVAVFVGIVDMREMNVRYCSAGHAGAFVRRGGHAEQLPVTGPLVGVERAFVFSSAVYPLRVGDLLIVATDGFTEARDTNGSLLDDRTTLALLERAPADPQLCADALIAGVRRFSGGTLADDLALLVLAVDGLPAAAAVPEREATPAVGVA